MGLSLPCIPDQSSTLIYEYNVFPPIPFQLGDVFGAFVPRGADSRLRPRCERDRGPLNYYQFTSRDANFSNINELDITSTSQSAVYHPLVTVEICKLIL